MNKVRKQRRSPVLPDWRRLVLGLLAVFLMCAQGSAAIAHTHSHDELAELAHSSHIAPISSDSPGPVKTNPVNSCPLCHSSLGASPLLPLSAMSFVVPPVLRGIATADFDRRPPGSPPSGVWRVRGPPSTLHI
jgi:hypothetical protein